MNAHRLVCAAAGLLVVLGTGAAVARAAGSPIGTWKAENERTYRWTALPGGGFNEYVMTSHRTSTNHCLVKANTLVYKYHPLGHGLYREDEFQWDKKCATSWALGHATIRIVVTPTRMTHSCDKQYTKICFTYTRTADTVAPVVQALASTGTAGGTTSLRYTVSDNSGKTWEEIDLYRGVLIRRYRTTLGPALKGHLYAYKLTATPASLKGKLTFCVHSHDAAGNVSKESCATLTIR